MTTDAATPAADPALPDQLGDFAIVGVLGTGGSGVVLDARWGHREVALKVLHPTLIATGRERTQFLEEARRLQDISHPGVVKVLASGELPDGRPYLAMEKLAGPTLAAKLAGGPIPIDRALALFEQLAGAVQALHDRGLVHRDLKPENVVLVGDAHAVLLDFGIAKALAAPASTTTQDGGVRGTPAYMAPERFFGQPASVATDVYELAVTLYAMLAGQLPWADCGDPEVRLNPASLGPSVPEPVDVEIRRALSTRAQNRPATARELAAAVLAAAGRPLGPSAARTTTQVPLELAQRGPAWFEQRGATGDTKGHTPLAWAPTARQHKRAEATDTPRRWWPIAAIGVAAVAAVVGWIVMRGDDPKPALDHAGAHVAGSAATETPGSAAGDPWAAADPEHPAAANGAATAPLRPVAELRREMTAAVGKLPDGTRTVLALGIAEMRADHDLGSILEIAAKRPEVMIMFGHSDDCTIGLADIDWLVMGFDAPGFQADGDVVVRGRWTRDQLEACLGALADGKPVAEPNTGVTRIDGKRVDYWVAMDGPIAVISTRDDKTGAHVAAMLARTAGPGGVAGGLAQQLDPDATMWMVVDQDDGYKLTEIEGLPAGADVAGWARVDNGLRGRMIGRFLTAKDAKQAETVMEKKVADAREQGGDMLGTFALSRADKDVTLDATLTPMTMSLAARAVAQPD